MTAQRKSGRDKITIVAEILEMTVNGELKSNIMWKAGLNYLMLNKYLDLMTRAQLLQQVTVDDKIMFKPTSRGRQYLYHCFSIMELLGENEDDIRRYVRFAHLAPPPIATA